MPRVRPLFIITLACATCLYALFVSMTWLHMNALWHGIAAASFTTTPDLASLDFTRFWYTGALLDHERGFAIPPIAWMQGLHLNLFAVSGNIYSDWLYPPTMDILAMAAPLAPLPLSLLLWDAACVLVAILLLRWAGLGWAAVAMGLLSPSTLQNLGMGQNGLLLGAVALAALLKLETSPRAAGALASLLCVKPPMALIMATALLHPRHWRALTACILSGIGLVTLSLILAGWPAWHWYLTTGRHAAATVLITPFSHAFLEAASTPFFMARSFNFSLHAAFALQSVCSFAGLVLGWLIWRHTAWPARSRAAALLCIGALLSPYGFFYDLTGFSMAMAMLVVSSPERLKPAYALLWLSPGCLSIVTGLTGHVYMPVAALVALLLVCGTSAPISASNSATCS